MENEKNCATSISATRDFYGIKQSAADLNSYKGNSQIEGIEAQGSLQTARSDFMMEGGSVQSTSIKKQGSIGTGKTVKFENDGPVQSIEKKSTNVDQTFQPTVASGGTSTIDYMRKAVLNLNQRVQDIERKISKVENVLKDQKSVIKKQVQVEKENWMS